MFSIKTNVNIMRLYLKYKGYTTRMNSRQILVYKENRLYGKYNKQQLVRFANYLYTHVV